MRALAVAATCITLLAGCARDDAEPAPGTEAATTEQPAPAATPTAPVSGRVRQPAAVARRLAELGHDTPRPVVTHRPRDAGGPVNLEGRILARLGPSPTEENMLIRDLGVPAAVLAPAILALELSGRVQRMAGGRLALSGG